MSDMREGGQLELQVKETSFILFHVTIDSPHSQEILPAVIAIKQEKQDANPDAWQLGMLFAQEDGSLSRIPIDIHDVVTIRRIR